MPAYARRTPYMPKYKKKQPTKRFKKAVRKVLLNNLESKHLLISSSSNVSTTASFVHLSNISAGDSSAHREGNKCLATSIDLRYKITIADTTNTVRLIVFSFTGGDTPTVDNVLDNAGTFFTEAALQGEPDVKFKIYYDKVFNMRSVYNPIVTGRIRKRLNGNKGLVLRYVDTTGSNLGAQQLWMLLISDSGAVTHPGVDFTGWLHFKER